MKKHWPSYSVLTRILSLFLVAAAQIGIAHAEVQEVEVIYPQTMASGQTLELTGTIEAKQNAQLSLQQAGLVEALYVDFGARVEAGDELLKLDDTLARLRLKELEASAAAAQIIFNESQRLYDEVLALSKTQVVAQTLIAERQSTLAGAQANLNRQQASFMLQQEIVARHTLVAPFAGVIAARYTDIGEWVQPQDWVFDLVANADLRLRLAIPQEYLGSIVAGATRVTMRPDNNPYVALDLLVSEVVAVSNNQTRTFTVLTDIPATAELVSGLSAKATVWLEGTAESLIWLPTSAVKTHPDGGTSVFAVRGNFAQRHIVEVVKQEGQMLAVRGAPQELPFVLKGVELLVDGTEVQATVVEAGSNAQ